MGLNNSRINILLSIFLIISNVFMSESSKITIAVKNELQLSLIDVIGSGISPFPARLLCADSLVKPKV